MVKKQNYRYRKMGSDRDGNDVELSKRNIKDIMHEHSDRVSDDAAIHMAYEAQRDIHRKSRAAKLIAQSNGRETVKEEDVRLVSNIVEIMGGED